MRRTADIIAYSPFTKQGGICYNIREVKIDRSILPSGKIGLAVSGGSDSVALAFLLTKGGKKKNAAKRFILLHVDHGLRKESKEEYKFVRALAKRLGVPFKGIHAKVERKSGESIEMAARRVRVAFFTDCVKKFKLDAIATGHHMDDVAETFLMRIRRASGPEGLAGIKPISQVGIIRFVRPLLGCRDKELKAYLKRYGEEWREDASNGDISIERNKVRHKIIPYLEEMLDPNLVDHIYKITRLLRNEKVS
ncbi:MAG: tRNA lysidine(34) synthetase TilS [Kiritimatiellae bacterium]|nr:tRNA lysidine(34) synthetase TilS [Kiritimatiellia bacterium]